MKKHLASLLIGVTLLMEIGIEQYKIQAKTITLQNQQDESLPYTISKTEQEELLYLSRTIYDTWCNQVGIAQTENEGALRNEDISLEEVAYTFCRYIDKGGVYLPSEAGIRSPYIGRLLVEGIWEDNMGLNENRLTMAEWNRLCERVEIYRMTNKPLAIDNTIKAKTIQGYREKLQHELKLEPRSVSKLKMSSSTLKVQDQVYNLYQGMDGHYVELETLRALGFLIDQQGGHYYMVDNSGSPKATHQEKANVTLEGTLVSEKLYYKDIQSYILRSENKVFVPLRILEANYTLQMEANQLLLIPQINTHHEALGYKEGRLYNLTDESLEVTSIHYFWNGQEVIQAAHTQCLLPGQSLEDVSKWYSLYDATYLTTIVKGVKGETISYEEVGNFGQNIDVLMKNYRNTQIQKEATQKATEIKKQEEIKKEKEKQEKQKEVQNNLEELFPARPVIATVLSNTNDLVKGQEVELSRENHGVYSVITNKGKIVKIAGSKLHIPPNEVTPKSQPTVEQIVGFINTREVESSTDYLVWTDLYHQRTYVFKGKSKNWSLVKRLICSTGKNATPTPRGVYSLKNKLPSFGQNKGYMCKNAFGFIGSSYLYHSILFDKTGSYIISGKKELGQRASHGCIRLLPEDSLWFYKTLPVGTKVWVN